ncbi:MULTISPECIES: hypothetical protein [Saccharopolyspora]|uniref:Uncharacterized protein n=1 Tax=Saccharopolyspora gregorii TaxID=33914 RepID=A0ABP6S236_9PSEU|nr:MULTISPECIES: hypothetical protein [Saccharopolyspora]MCA1185443.1 hypothetical protein [Saccharopolyspora sp. 6T]MCA1192334.1 hypothetical protein [Saccharopolyspora sp. 6V]MCA1225216.1 hypothetical protein [Saccharopolyspora sp. 6M]MCA1279545.1 hypothetical protein [Saccharopolyspora sp. 7B]
MSGLDRLVFGFLLLDAVVLALVEVLYLPLWIGSTPFPITTAVAAVTTPMLVSAAGRLAPSRRVAAAPLVVWFATIFVFGLFGPGGDVMLMGNDWRTLLLIGAGTLPSAMMLGIVLGRSAGR